MKKTILAVALVFTVIFSAFGFTAYAAEGEEVITIGFEPYGYKVERGDNLTSLAKRFGTTADELFEANKWNSKCVKSRNLILAGCWIAVLHLVTLDSVLEVTDNYDQALNKARVETKQAKDATVFYSYIALFLAIFLIVVFVLWHFTGNRLDEWREKATENSKTSYKLDQSLADANKELAKKNELLATVHADLKNSQTILRSYDGLIPGSLVKLKAQSGEEIIFKVVLVGLGADGSPDVQEVECISNDCKTKVKPQNALSHYFKQHEATTEKSFPD